MLKDLSRSFGVQVLILHLSSLRLIQKEVWGLLICIQLTRGHFLLLKELKVERLLQRDLGLIAMRNLLTDMQPSDSIYRCLWRCNPM